MGAHLWHVRFIYAYYSPIIFFCDRPIFASARLAVHVYSQRINRLWIVYGMQLAVVIVNVTINENK